MQAEIVEQMIKDRDRISNELAKLRSDISTEVSHLYKQVIASSGSSSNYDTGDWCDQIKMVKR